MLPCISSFPNVCSIVSLLYIVVDTQVRKQAFANAEQETKAILTVDDEKLSSTLNLAGDLERLQEEQWKATIDEYLHYCVLGVEEVSQIEQLAHEFMTEPAQQCIVKATFGKKQYQVS